MTYLSFYGYLNAYEGFVLCVCVLLVKYSLWHVP